MLIAYFILSGLFILCSVLSGLRWRWWGVYACNAARFHLAVFMLVMLAVGFLWLDVEQTAVGLTQLLLAVGVFYHFSQIASFTPLVSTEIEKGGSHKTKVRFLTANVRMSNDDYPRLLEVVKKHQPDVVLLTEPGPDWVEAISELEETYPHTLLQPQDNTYGLAMYSRLPLAKAEINFIIEDDIPSFHTELELPEGGRLQFIGLHPRPPAPWTEPAHKDFELLTVAGMTNWNALPTVVSGDLNDVGWSPTTRQFKRLSGLKDPRIGRGFFNTYNALIPFFRVPIDHFFVSDKLSLIRMEKLEKFGSDHFPVLLEVGV